MLECVHKLFSNVVCIFAVGVGQVTYSEFIIALCQKKQNKTKTLSGSARNKVVVGWKIKTMIQRS